MSPAMNFTKYVKDNFIMFLPKAINRKKLVAFVLHIMERSIAYGK
jgi:hypothetical protein